MLQSFITGDFLFAFCVGLFLLVGIPVLTTLLIKGYWNIAGKKGYSKTARRNAKDILPFISIIIFSTIALLLLVYLLVTLLNNSSPSH